MPIFVLMLISAWVVAFTLWRIQQDVPLTPALRTAFLGIVSGAMAGFVLGGALRVAMRIAAAMGGGREISVRGTLFLVAMPAVFLAPAGVLTLAVLRRIPARNSGIRAAVAGTVPLGLLAIPVFVGSEIRDRGNVWVNRTTFALAFLAFGFAFDRAHTWLERGIPPAVRPRPPSRAPA